MSWRDVDLDQDLFYLSDHGLFTGDLVRYDSNGDDIIHGLVDETTYSVDRVNGDQLRLLNVSTRQVVDITGGATAGKIHKLYPLSTTTIDSRPVPADDINLVTNEFIIKGHGFKDGEKVIYRTKGGLPIGGLVDGAEYRIVKVSDDRFKLRYQATEQDVDLNQAAEKGSVHAFEIYETKVLAPLEFTPNLITSPINSVFFNPTAVPPINAVDNTIRIPKHRFAAGEKVKVTYLAVNGNPIGGLGSGTDYWIKVVDSDTIQLSTNSSLSPVVDLTSAGTGTQHGFERVSEVVKDDQPIRGLENGVLYFVTAIDADTVRLSGSLGDALAGNVIQLDPSKASGSVHTLKTNAESGVTVRSTLRASNSVDGSVGVGGAPKFHELLTAGELQNPGLSLLKPYASTKNFKADKDQDLLNALRDNDARTRIRGSGSNTNDIGSLAAGLSVNIVMHHVDTVVGPQAVIKSGQDVKIDASVAKQKVKLKAQGTISSDDGGTNKDTKLKNRDEGKKVAIGAGIALGFVSNEVHTSISSGATINAHRRPGHHIQSRLPIDRKTYRTCAVSGFYKDGKFDQNGGSGDEVSRFMSGKLGLTDIVNVWVSTTAGGSGGDKGSAGAAKLTITGSMAVMTYDNTASTVVHSGVLINQDPQYRSLTQSVFVTAATEMQTVNVAGQFSLNLTREGIQDAARTSLKKGKIAKVFDVRGNRASQVGIGGSVLVQLLDNHTEARIEEGAHVYTSPIGILDVRATEDVFSFDLAQAGGKSGSFGLSGSISFLKHDSGTIAQIEGGTTIDAGTVSVKSKNDGSHVGIVGAIQTGEDLSIGVSVGIQVVNRKTRSIVGNERADFDVDAVESFHRRDFAPRSRPCDGRPRLYRPLDGGGSLSQLAAEKPYYVIRVNDDVIKLASTAANAQSGSAIAVSRMGKTHQFDFISPRGTNVSWSGVTVAGNSFTSTGHGLKTGDAVVYRTVSGPRLDGLVEGQAYFVIRVSDNVFKLATTRANSASAVAVPISTPYAFPEFRFDRAMSVDAEGGLNVEAENLGKVWNFGVAGSKAGKTSSKAAEKSPLENPFEDLFGPSAEGGNGASSGKKTAVGIAGNVNWNQVANVTKRTSMKPGLLT